MRALTGVDAVEVARFRRALAVRPRLAHRLFSDEELSYATTRPDPPRHLAARFAAKEAVGKLLGCGVTSWQEIVVHRGSTGPRVELRGRAAERARLLGVRAIALSLSHTATIAVASAVAVSESEEEETGCRAAEDH